MVLRFYACRTAYTVYTRLNDADTVRVEVRNMVVLLKEGREDVIPEAEIQRQPWCNVPIVLGKDAGFPCGVVGRIQIVVACRSGEDAFQQTGSSHAKGPAAFTLVVLNVERDTPDATSAEPERMISAAVDHAAVQLIAVVFIL